MDCDRIRDDLGRREAGLLDPGAIQDLERHLGSCDACRAYSRRMRTLVSVLEQYPEIRTLPRTSAFRRLSRGRVAVVAAALLMALAVPLVAPLLGSRMALEGGFDLPSRGVLVAQESRSALVAHEHRLRFRKGTRVRVVGADEVFLEEGRLDVSGLREGASGLKIGTPLGRVVVVGTRFVVEVTPVNKSQAAVAAGSFVVGVMVSSGAVTYAEYHRLEAGQGIVDETGKSPRRVAAADAERRLRTAADRERDLETRLAALGIEKERLSGELAALERGESSVPRAPLSPEDRRARTRRLAQVLIKSFYQVRSSANPITVPLDEKELKRLAESGESFTMEHEVQTRAEVDGKALSEVLQLASELGMNFFDSASFCSKGDLVEELMMAVLEARTASASGLRPAVEAAVRQAYGALPQSWESRPEERLAQARALRSALVQLEGTLSVDQTKDLYETAWSLVATPDTAMLGYADPKWRTDWVERLAKTMELDAANRPVLEAAVDEMIARLEKAKSQPGTGAGNRLDFLIRCREAGADLVRQLSARFPDRKEKIDRALDPR